MPANKRPKVHRKLMRQITVGDVVAGPADGWRVTRVRRDDAARTVHAAVVNVADGREGWIDGAYDDWRDLVNS
jgi:hypothetical protein